LFQRLRFLHWISIFQELGALRKIPFKPESFVESFWFSCVADIRKPCSIGRSGLTPGIRRATHERLVWVKPYAMILPKTVVFDALPRSAETPAFQSVKTPRQNLLSFDRFLAP